MINYDNQNAMNLSKHAKYYYCTMKDNIDFIK